MPMEGSDGAIREARRLHQLEPDRYFYADQYNNDANWRAHYDTTGPEILEQTGGRITHFVAGLGTSGTFVGTGRRLREHRADIRLISVQPDSPLHAIEGLKHMEIGDRARDLRSGAGRRGHSCTHRTCTLADAAARVGRRPARRGIERRRARRGSGRRRART